MTRRKVFDMIRISNRSDFISTAFVVVLVIAIVLNILAMFLETFASLSAYEPLFHGIETVTLVFFCVEYALRIWTADDCTAVFPVRLCCIPNAEGGQDFSSFQDQC